MKAMQCELCGATDIIKDGDYFVCQSCGMKYTTESARKMMVEGVVQVEGTVKVDNSHKIENFLSLAKKAHDSDNEKEAEEYANKVLEIDPENWDALYVKGIAAGWQTTISNNRIPEAIDYFSQAISNCPEGADLEELKQKIAKDISSLSLAMINLRCNNYIKFPSPENASSIVTEVLSSAVLSMKLILLCGVEPEDFKSRAALAMNAAAVQAWKSIWSDYTDDKPLLPLENGVVFKNYRNVSPGDQSCYAIPSKYEWDRFTERGDGCISVIEAAISIDDNDDDEDITRYDNLLFVAEKVRDSCSIAYVPGDQYTKAKWVREYSFTDSAIAARNEKIAEWEKSKEETMRKIHQQSVDESWDAHEEEKTQIEKRIQDIEAEIVSIGEREDYVAAKKNLEKLNNRISDKNNELEQLGTFKLSAKKEIKNQIDALDSEKQQILDQIEQTEILIKAKRVVLSDLREKLDNPLG